MERFITKSDLSKQILKSAKLSSSLPVNTLIYGQVGVGKKLLSAEILPDSTAIKANELEKLIISNQIDLSEYNSLIIYEIDKVLNLEQFLNSLKYIKLVATSLEKYERFNTFFAIKI